MGLGHVVALEAKKRSQWSFLANDTVNIITRNVSLLGSDQIRSDEDVSQNVAYGMEYYDLQMKRALML